MHRTPLWLVILYTNGDCLTQISQMTQTFNLKYCCQEKEAVTKSLKQRFARLRAAGRDDTPVSSVATAGRCNTVACLDNHARSEHTDDTGVSSLHHCP